ncbi:hypothetical protein PIB30_061335 [Stylosanthes scabra]|uniref:Uncharacterized protein n=1 Tax=Stylosanthes scabra TaxID=79078 RepID=A0ABU6YLH6_9FABA|nr:hypothetical protein [Stylosanthes scabra]
MSGKFVVLQPEKSALVVMSSSSASSSSTSSDETRGNELGNTSTSHTTEPTLSSVRHDGVGHALHGSSA